MTLYKISIMLTAWKVLNKLTLLQDQKVIKKHY